ncbi:hypothetical protein Xcel_2338 [Xylanimonas cellulosilytica DSM 15894]|uniref:DUF732 domain-containing protein n=2 Tax=Xylanimonas TaxID=186188 RepID=D1BVN6_XYLCX|nr:hypothetical protein Xcel_2338 [Xylanimonas cellulosilytica DSM 15894]
MAVAAVLVLLTACSDDHAEFIERARASLDEGGNQNVSSMSDDDLADIGTAICLIATTEDPGLFQEAVDRAAIYHEQIGSQDDWDRLLVIAHETLCPEADPG